MSTAAKAMIKTITTAITTGTTITIILRCGSGDGEDISDGKKIIHSKQNYNYIEKRNNRSTL
jgi:hypothetical protein